MQYLILIKAVAQARALMSHCKVFICVELQYLNFMHDNL